MFPSCPLFSGHVIPQCNHFWNERSDQWRANVVCDSHAGWQPQHLAVKRSKGSSELLAAVPLYVKYHSMGEFIFDQVRRSRVDVFSHLFLYTPSRIRATPSRDGLWRRPLATPILCFSKDSKDSRRFDVVKPGSTVHLCSSTPGHPNPSALTAACVHTFSL